jgi:epoxyqueuosine reductase
LNQKEKKLYIKQAGLELGFCDVRFARAQPLNDEFDRFKHWVDNGYNATMKYYGDRLEKRFDVRNILPDAKTVIVFAYNYFESESQSFNHNIPLCPPLIRKEKDYSALIRGKVSDNFDKLKVYDKDEQDIPLYPPLLRGKEKEFGKISRYSLVKDYHNFLLPKLKAVIKKIEEIESGAMNKEYVDTGPVMEKAWAARAGIGWQGKNGVIISRKNGSWIFLGIIITTAEFEPDRPINDYCGTCTKCIDACPTKAIVEPKVIDAKKCIAYWTTESKADNDIPDFVSKNLNNWIYGCDICQEVCPWNKKLEKNDKKNEFRNLLSIQELLNMNDEQFHKSFDGSPIERIKIKGLKRNANAIARNK